MCVCVTICVCIYKRKSRSKRAMLSMSSQLGNLIISLPSELQFKSTKKEAEKGEEGVWRDDEDGETEGEKKALKKERG